MILSELFQKDINNQQSFQRAKLLIVIIGILSMFISLKITSIVSSLLLALSFYSGAFIIPMIAALFNFRYNKNLGIAAMLSGGLLALSGKLLITFKYAEVGQYVLIAGFAINALLIFVPFGQRKPN